MKEYDPQKFSLQRHEYVWIKIDIHSTLFLEYFSQSLAGAEGTFPIDSQEAQENACSLVDDFLEEIGFPVEGTSGEGNEGSEFPCPMFRPRLHLVLIDRLFRHDGVDVVVFPVHKVSSFGSSPPDESIFHRLLRPTLVPIVSGDDAERHPDNAIRLRTTAGLDIKERISQNVYSSHMFVVGCVRGDASDAVRLDSTSSHVFNEVAGITHETFNEEYPKALAVNGGVETTVKMPCGCDVAAHLYLSGKDDKSFAALSDIVVEITYEASSDEVSRWAGGLGLSEEEDKTLQITEIFARWLLGNHDLSFLSNFRL